MRALLQSFGISALRPAQQAALDAIGAGRDVLVILPTGGGKSLCYQLPAAVGASPALVVSPLVALMKDQVDALRRRGIAAAQLSGAIAARERDAVWSQLEGGAITLLYLAPEALTSARTLERLRQVAPRLLAVDEAHCISEWGESFRPSYLALGAVRQALGMPVTIALTATATPRTARDIVTRLALRDPVVVSGGFDRRNLRLRVLPVATDDRRQQHLVSLAQGAPGPAVIYATTRRQAERVATMLRHAGVVASPFHAGLPTSERAVLQDAFQSNRIAAIVATNAFGMGVDKPDVRLVLHAAPPLTLEAYYQEAGRGGRDGLPADCTLLLAPHDLDRARNRLRRAHVSSELLRQLSALLARPDARHAMAGSELHATRRLAMALSSTERDVGTALRLLTEGGVIEAGAPSGALRVVASVSRLTSDRSLDAANVTALRRMLSFPALPDGAPPRYSLDTVRRVAPDGDARAFVARLESRQLAVWCPGDPPWRHRARPSRELLDELCARHATRTARDQWRLEQVARFVSTTRCRRHVLLRYFGDASPRGSCGACDPCGLEP